MIACTCISVSGKAVVILALAFIFGMGLIADAIRSKGAK